MHGFSVMTVPPRVAEDPHGWVAATLRRSGTCQDQPKPLSVLDIATVCGSTDLGGRRAPVPAGKGLAACVAAAGFIVAVASTATAAPTISPTPPADSTIQGYVDLYGVSVAEAERRLELEQVVGTYNKALAAASNKSFGGLWLSHLPTFQVHVGGLSPAQGDAAVALAPPALVGAVSTEQVGSSPHDLDRALSTAAAQLDATGISADLEQSLPTTT